MSQNLSSAAVVIGALRVNKVYHTYYLERNYFSMVYATSLDTSHILIVLLIWVHVQVDKYKFLKIFATQTCKWGRHF